jgi:hypothetical protein
MVVVAQSVERQDVALEATGCWRHDRVVMDRCVSAELFGLSTR